MAQFDLKLGQARSGFSTASRACGRLDPTPSVNRGDIFFNTRSMTDDVCALR